MSGPHRNVPGPGTFLSSAFSQFLIFSISLLPSPNIDENIDIFGATKIFTVCNHLIISLGATKMNAGAIKMKCLKNIDVFGATKPQSGATKSQSGATKKFLTRA